MSWSRNPQRNIVLAGFTGSGKSTIGRSLARRLHRNFIDFPVELDRRMKLNFRTLTGIGKKPDEDQVEAILVHDLSYRQQTIISLDSDTLANEDYYNEFKVYSYSVFIDLPFESLWARISKDPSMLRKLGTVDRNSIYQKWARLRQDYVKCDLHINADNLTVTRAVNLIIHCFLT